METAKRDTEAEFVHVDEYVISQNGKKKSQTKTLEKLLIEA